MNPDKQILSVNKLNVSVQNNGKTKDLLSDISFSLKCGEILGIIGESGSGKSLTALSVMQLLRDRKNFKCSGEILFGNPAYRLDELDEKKMCAIRGNRISIIFQDPMSALNPVKRCGAQFVELIKMHSDLKDEEIKPYIFSLFRKVKLHETERIYNAYPHEISGGQAQRVMIAMSIAHQPDILIADEATSGLDVVVQGEIIQLLKEVIRENNTALIFISHDLELIKRFSQRVLIMKQGKLIEQGISDEVFAKPAQNYTLTLLNAGKELKSVTKKKAVDLDQPIVMLAENLSFSYSSGFNWFKNKTSLVHAVQEVTFKLQEGEVLGILGESGSGKSTLAKCLSGIIHPNSGSITYPLYHENSMHFSRKDLAKLRQIIFQDPYSALNPKFTVIQSVTEPLTVHKMYSNNMERKQKAEELLDMMGLHPDLYSSFPNQLSGGERQRVCIARALALQPKILILDEAVSSLDSVHCIKILQLLKELQNKFHLSYILISHDMQVVRYMSDNVLIMKDGKVEEYGDTEQIFCNPHTAYTKWLISINAEN